MRKGREPEQIAAFFRGRPRDQSSVDGALELGLAASGPRGKSRGVDDDVNFLGTLDLKDFRDRTAAARGGLPVNLVESVAGGIFA